MKRSWGTPRTTCGSVLVSFGLMAMLILCGLSSGAEPLDTPPVIAIIAPFSDFGEETALKDSEGGDICHLLPLGIYENSTWGRYCVDSFIPWTDKKLKIEPECESRIAALSDSTFFFTTGLEFRTTQQCHWQIMDVLFTAFCGRCPDAAVGEDPVVVLNRKPQWEIVPRAQSKISPESLAPNALKAVEKERLEPWTVEHPGYDALKYQPLEIVESKTFRMTPTRNVAWIYASLPYPAALAPKEDPVPEFDLWYGEYYALVELSEGTPPRVLWEEGYFLDDYWSHRRLKFLGVCDGNADEIAEVVLEKGGHEYREFILLALQDGQYREVSHVGAAL
jgi:hypothetical protein